MSRPLVKNLSFFTMGNSLRIEFFFIKAIYHNFYWFTCVTVYFLHLKQLFHSTHALKMFCMLYIPINLYWCINQLLILLIIIIIIIIIIMIIIKMMLIMGVKQWTFFVWIYENDNSLYYTHFEITGGPCNLIGSNWCDLFVNRTIFCFKLHLFPSQWGGYTKNKTINQISRLV